MAVDSDRYSIDEGTADFLRKKGTLEILTEIGKEGAQRHTDLREELLLSSSTIQKRLNDGKERNLWELSLEERGNVEAKVYKLTSLGKQLYSDAKQEELTKLYRARRGLVRSIEQRERKVIIDSAPDDANWVSDISMEKYEIETAQKFLSQF